MSKTKRNVITVFLMLHSCSLFQIFSWKVRFSFREKTVLTSWCSNFYIIFICYTTFGFWCMSQECTKIYQDFLKYLVWMFVTIYHLYLTTSWYLLPRPSKNFIFISLIFSVIQFLSWVIIFLFSYIHVLPHTSGLGMTCRQ